MKHITLHGLDIHCVDRGAGRVVLLVHGFPLDHNMWNAQIDALAAGYRVIAPDLPGLGRSAAGGAEAVGMEQFADDLAALLDALGIAEPVVLCGLSMGGYIAFQFWKQYPARLRALVLCDTRAAADSPEAARLRLITAERVLREGPAVVVEAMLPRLLAPATPQQQPELVEAVRGMMAGCDPRGIAAALRGMARRPDSTPLLPAINCPTLLIVGERDVISPPAEMAAMARAIRGARLVTIAGAGHLSPMERPAEVSAAILQFVDGLA
jgi:pimeloyl-ACP methyl ester carboxylesterase